MEDHELYSGFIRLHILHHASEGPIFGLWIIEELARHGYRLSQGMLYPLRHGMERHGYLKSAAESSGGRRHGVHEITLGGEGALHTAREKVREG